MKPVRGYIAPQTIETVDLICVSMKVPNDIDYIAAFRGAVTELLKPYNWQTFNYTDDPEERDKIVAFWNSFLLQNLEIGNCTDILPATTYRFTNTSILIEWLPQDPFLEPDYVPTGYQNPPWAIVTSGSAYQLLGYKVGDVVSDLSRFPTGSLPTIVPPDGFARLRLSFSVSGAGSLYCNLLNFPAGSILQAQLDGEIASLRYIDVNLDALGAPPETVTTIVYEQRVEVAGAHYLDLTLLPLVNDAIPFIFYGGGIRDFLWVGDGELTP